jgi:hypothetical protein
LGLGANPGYEHAGSSTTTKKKDGEEEEGAEEEGARKEEDEDKEGAEDEEEVEEGTNLPSISVEDNERLCTQYFWVCANRIATSPPKFNLPSVIGMLIDEPTNEDLI